MEHQTGWKPLPVILKIIWVILLIGVVFSIPAVFTAGAAGYTLFGINVYGYGASILMFTMNLLLPIWLIIAMMKRYSWTWIYGVALYLVLIVNELFMFKTLDQLVQIVMSEMTDEVLDLIPNVEGIIYASAVASVILGVLIDVFFLLMLVLKRKYFTKASDHSMENLPGAGN